MSNATHEREQTTVSASDSAAEDGAALQDQTELGRERWKLLHQIDALLDGPMIVLSLVWLGLLILDFTQGLGPILSTVSYAIWGLFVLHFLMGIVLAPSKAQYLRHNWLTALALLLPAFRMLRAVRAFRLLRAARAARSVSLVRLFTTLNRGMRAVNVVIGHRGIGFVILLTTMVTFGGAAGMVQFESPAALGERAEGLDGYGEALWWTAMTMTTMGSDYFPRSLEGRILGWLLALYAFTVFGYITATIASVFLARDAATASVQARSTSETAEARDAVASDGARLNGDRAHLTAELAALRDDVADMRRHVALLTETIVSAKAGAGLAHMDALAACGEIDRTANLTGDSACDNGSPDDTSRTWAPGDTVRPDGGGA